MKTIMLFSLALGFGFSEAAFAADRPSPKPLPISQTGQPKMNGLNAGRVVQVPKKEDPYAGLGEGLFATGLEPIQIEVLKVGVWPVQVYLLASTTAISSNQTSAIPVAHNHKGGKMTLTNAVPGELIFSIDHSVNRVRSDTQHLTREQLESLFFIGPKERNLDLKAHAIVRKIGPKKYSVGFEDTWNTPEERKEVYFRDAVIIVSGGVTMNDGISSLVAAARNPDPNVSSLAMKTLEQMDPDVALQVRRSSQRGGKK